MKSFCDAVRFGKAPHFDHLLLLESLVQRLIYHWVLLFLDLVGFVLLNDVKKRMRPGTGAQSPQDEGIANRQITNQVEHVTFTHKSYHTPNQRQFIAGHHKT